MGLLDTVNAGVKYAASSLGKGLLGKGTQADANPDAQAYKLYAAEQTAMGQTPLPYAEWVKIR